MKTIFSQSTHCYLYLLALERSLKEGVNEENKHMCSIVMTHFEFLLFMCQECRSLFKFLYFIADKSANLLQKKTISIKYLNIINELYGHNDFDALIIFGIFELIQHLRSIFLAPIVHYFF